MSAQPRIAYLTPNALLPPSRGGRLRAFHLWRAMSAYADVFPIVVGDTEGAAARSLMRIAGARFFPRRRFRAKLRPGEAGAASALRAPPGLWEALNEPELIEGLAEELAAPEALVSHSLNAGRVERLLATVARLRPQAIVLCDTTLGLLAPALRSLGAPVIVGPHNFDSALYETIAERAPTETARLWNRLAARAFRGAEAMFAPCVDQLWVCSEEDARRFGGLVDPGRIRVVPNVYDVEAPSPMRPDSRDLVFVGQSNYFPNQDAIGHLLRISERLDARGIEHRLRIVGRASEAAKAQARSFPSVEMMGFAPSVAAALDGAAVVPVPLTMGGGTRLKVLEAFAYARPVLSTPIGVEGIACEHEVSAVVEADLEAFPERVEELLRDRRRAERIALAGWELAKRRYSHEALLGYVGGALSDLGLTAGKPSGVTLGRNLGARVEFETAVFNTMTRMVVWRAIVAAAAPLEALSAALSGETAGDLPNAFAQLRPVGPGKFWVNASAILPATVSPEKLEMRLSAWGVPIFRWSAPRDIPRQTAGLLSLEPDEADGAELVAWTNAPALSFSPGLLKPAAAWRASGGGFVLASATYRRDVADVEVSPADGVGQSFAQLKTWLQPAGRTSHRLQRLKDKHAGEVAWIIGNGPSVRVEDLDRLAGRLVICFNRFHLAHAITRLRPAYTFSGDAQMIEDFGQRIVDESGGVVFIAHHAAPDLVGDYIWLRQAPVFPPLFSKRPDYVVSPGGSTPFVAMQVAYYMGVRKFYFYGADFTFRFASATAGGDAFRSAAGEGNHFIANYRSGRSWCPPSFVDIGASFLNAKLTMEAEGGFIRNVTRGGLLEIFPREDFESALTAA